MRENVSATEWSSSTIRIVRVAGRVLGGAGAITASFSWETTLGVKAGPAGGDIPYTNEGKTGYNCRFSAFIPDVRLLREVT